MAGPFDRVYPSYPTATTPEPLRRSRGFFLPPFPLVLRGPLAARFMPFVRLVRGPSGKVSVQQVDSRHPPALPDFFSPRAFSDAGDSCLSFQGLVGRYYVLAPSGTAIKLSAFGPFADFQGAVRFAKQEAQESGHAIVAWGLGRLGRRR